MSILRGTRVYYINRITNNVVRRNTNALKYQNLLETKSRNRAKCDMKIKEHIRQVVFS